MTNKPLSLITMLAALAISPALRAQDWCQWTTLSVEKEFSKKFSMELDEEMRLESDMARLNLFYTQLGADYKITKRFKAGLSYRFTQKYTNKEEFNYRHRLIFDLSYQYKIHKLSLALRSRLQTETRDLLTADGLNPDWMWRPKLEAKYSIKKFAPFAGIEWQFQLKDPRAPEADQQWNRYRLYAGCDYKINKRHKIGAYIQLQREFEVYDPAELNIVGLQYAFSLPFTQEEKEE